MKQQITINVDSGLETEYLVSVLVLGLCVAIENKALTIREADNYLFTPYTMSLLAEAGASSELVRLVHLGTELEDFESILPERLQDRLNNIKSSSLRVLQSMPKQPLVLPRSSPEWPEPKENWLQLRDKEE